MPFPAILTACLFFILFLHYSIFSSVQLTYFLHGLHLAHPAFLAKDWFVAYHSPPHPFFTEMVRFFESFSVLPPVFFAIYVLQIFLLIFAIFRLCRLFSDDIRIPVLTCFFLLFYFSDGLGQSTLFSNIVQPTDLAVPFYLLALTFLFENKILAAGILLGCSGLFHIHFAISGSLVFFFFMLFKDQSKNKFISILPGGLFFLLLSSPNWVPIAKSFSLTEPAASPEIFKMFLNFRSPHHYRPSVFELSHSFRILFPTLLFLILKSRFEKDAEKDIFLKVEFYIALILGLCLIGALSTELFYNPFLARLFFFRLSPSVLLLSLIICSHAFIEILNQKKPYDLFLLALTLTIFLIEKDSRLFIFLSSLLLISWKFSKNQNRLAYGLGFGSAMITLITFVATHRLNFFLINIFLSASLVFLLKLNWGSGLKKFLLAAIFLFFHVLLFNSFRLLSRDWQCLRFFARRFHRPTPN